MGAFFWVPWSSFFRVISCFWGIEMSTICHLSPLQKYLLLM
jgi:hypothetical protein